MTFDSKQTPEHPEIQDTPSSMRDWPEHATKKVHTGRLIALIILLVLLLGYYFFILLPKGKNSNAQFHESDINIIEAELSSLEEVNQ